MAPSTPAPRTTDIRTTRTHASRTQAPRTRRPRAVALALGTAVAVVSAVVTATPAAAAGYATTAGPWSATTALTGADGRQTLIDAKTAGDGTTFALWRDRAADGTHWDFDIAVKAAGSGTWGASHTLATGRASTSPAVLTVTPTGQGVVTWVEGRGPDGDLAAVAATWSGGSWSEPVPLATYPNGTYLGLPRLASAADGTLTAVWDQGEFDDYKVMTATRAPGAGTWSTPQPLAAVTTGSVYDLAVTVTPNGAATAVWDVYDQVADGNQHTVFTATRATADGSWSEGTVLPGVGLTDGVVQVTSDAKGATTVLWRGANAAGTGTDLKSVTRTSPSANWGGVQTAVPGFSYDDGSDPLTAPDGDLTYVWVGWSSADGEPVVRSVTRSASTGTWSAPRTLSTGYVTWDVDASIGADGTVQVVWPQVPSIDNGNDHYLQWAVRADGTWSRATALNSEPVPDVSSTEALSGEVAAGPDGRATVLSREAVGSGDYTSQVSVQWQTLLTKPVITSKATLSGTVRTGSKVTCDAAWTGTGAKTAWSWLRDGTVVSGATGRTRTLTAADYKHKVSCRATVTNNAGSVRSTSAAATVAVGPALRATKAPAITGTARTGYRLTAAHGTWSPTATSYTYVWKRDGRTITGATRSTYVPAKADKGHKITAKVTAKRYGWTDGSATTASVTVR
ncbi:hypothetical protein QA860_40945 [Streptomyces stelliscabiei]|uniref:hypothetical protein n=1 Tax=Streptomyces TaxID=1883 RepID=UPI000BD2C527|nr:hypothetical protein [Streptomyces sp. 1222.2]SOD66453.1 hypothetical protein SAMN06272781_0635 [Streptomyces sp. 1222.2]